MKQGNLFGEADEAKLETEYTTKIKAPIYEPKNRKPFPLELYDSTKYNRLKTEISNSDLPDDVKKFLIIAATRHIVFNYSLIADFYAHSEKEVQHLMEHSGLVIIDFDKAIEYGYVKLGEEIGNLYQEDYKDK